MVLWAGIDEAGYGPLLGPLVVAGTAFSLDHAPREGQLWDMLEDSLVPEPTRADGRLVVNDSKKVYTPSRGVRLLEEGVLSFFTQMNPLPTSVGDFMNVLLPPDVPLEDGTPWTQDVASSSLPVRSNASAIASKSAVLEKTLRQNNLTFSGARAVVVLPTEYNSIIRQTRNKARLLWQKCGMLLQMLWNRSKGGKCYVLIDRHGGRQHYRKQLRDSFPNARLTVQREGDSGSVYTLADPDHFMWLAFKSDGDQHALPTALGSMVAKYTRELYMQTFNEYWTSRVEGIKPTAGYAQDAHRFLEDIGEALQQNDIDRTTLVRGQ